MDARAGHDEVTEIATTGLVPEVPGSPGPISDGSPGRAYREVRAASDPSPELAEGARLGERYEIVRKLGQGGMGVVYEARNTNVEHIRYAIKTLLPGKATADTTHFLQEARRASRVRSPHVVQIFDFGTDSSSDLTYMVMDYIGEDVEAYVRRHGGTLPAALAVELCIQVCEALIAAHAEKLVHRDIKPLNCLLRTEGDRVIVVVTDFGIARDILGTVLQTDGLEADQSAWTAVGTPGYIASEVWLREAGADHRVDIYSVGAMLFRMLTGKPPPLAPTADELRASVPASLLPVVTRALARLPRDRYPSARALQSALRDASAALAAPAPASVAPPAHRWMVLSTVMVALAAVSLVVTLLVRSGDARPVASAAPADTPAAPAPRPAVATPPVRPPADVIPPTDGAIAKAAMDSILAPTDEPVTRDTKAAPLAPKAPRNTRLPAFSEKRAAFHAALQTACKQLGPCAVHLALKKAGEFKDDTLETILHFKFGAGATHPAVESRDRRLDLGKEGAYKRCVESRMRSVKKFSATLDGGELSCPVAL